MTDGQLHRTTELEMPGGEFIRGDYYYAATEGPTPIVVFAHGLGSTRGGEKVSAFRSECQRRGWALMATDFRGHGQSDGSMVELSGARLIEDLTATVIEARRLAGGPLLLVGSSMGGWASAWLSSIRPDLVSACVLIAPALHFFEWLSLTDHERREWARTGRHRLRTEYLDLELGYQLCSDAPLYPYEHLLTRFTTPALIFHGMRDETIPCQFSLDFVERCAEERIDLFLSRSGDHRLLALRHLIAREGCELLAGLEFEAT